MVDVQFLDEDSQWTPARGRGGAVYTADRIQGLIEAGRGYGAGIGTLSDGEALPAAGITTLRPQLWIVVPSGSVLVPIYCAVQVEDSGATGAFEVALGFARSDVSTTAGSAADWGPINLNSSFTDNGGFTARQEATGNVGADFVNNIWRAWKSEDNAATPATAGGSNFEWSGIGGKFYPVLIGPASIMLYIGSSAAPTVTAQIHWVSPLRSDQA